jgi:hypothetical protein
LRVNGHGTLMRTAPGATLLTALAPWKLACPNALASVPVNLDAVDPSQLSSAGERRFSADLDREVLHYPLIQEFRTKPKSVNSDRHYSQLPDAAQKKVGVGVDSAFALRDWRTTSQPGSSHAVWNPELPPGAEVTSL